MDLYIKARDTLRNNLYITLATVDKLGNPWVAPVYFVFSGYKFYWMSNQSSQHSINLESNEVMAVIFDSRVPHGEGFGVYVKGRVEIVEDIEDLEQIIDLLGSRINRNDRPPVDTFLGKNPRRVYSLTVAQMWVNTFDPVTKDQRCELDLNKI